MSPGPRRIRPLARGTLAFAAGVAAGLALVGLHLRGAAYAGPGAAWAAAFLCLALAAAAARQAARSIRRAEAEQAARVPNAATPAAAPERRPPPLSRGTVVLAALFCGGTANGAAAGHALDSHPLARLPQSTRLEVAGTLEARPGPDGSAWLVADSARPVKAAARRDRVKPPVEDGAGWRPLRARVRLRASGGGAAGRRGPEMGGLPAGGVVLSGSWSVAAPRGALPRRAERVGWLDVREARPLGAAGVGLPGVRAAAQAKLRAWLGPGAPAAEAMLLARRETLSREARERFAAAGLSHLLAISGLHVAVVAGVFLTLAHALRVRRALAVRGAGIGVLAYVTLLGFPHAATRAATQICLVMAARATQRPADPYSLMAAAALLLLLLDPVAIAEPGFQMSFAGVFGLLAWHRPIGRVLAALPGKPLRDAVAASVAATVATAPIASWTFGQAAPIGLLANLVAIPLAGLAVPALVATLLAGTLWEPAGALLGGGAASLLAMLDAVAGAAASVPGGHFPVARPDLWVVAGAALTAGVTLRAAAACRDRLRRRYRRLAAAGAACAAALAGGPIAAALAPPTLELHVIDVGQGDAVALRTPRGRWLLVDAGPRSRDFDAGRAIVVPYLLRQGAGELEALLLTHPDADHIGGAAAVVGMLDPEVVIDPASPTGKAQYLDALREAGSAGGRWARAAAGAEVALDGVRLVVLAPDSASLAAPSGANDISVVARVEFGEFRALLMGDAPVEVERRLVASDPGALRSDLLKVGHHGSHTSTGAELLAAARPAYAVIPVGRRNRYGHPHRVVVERLEAAGVAVLRTDRDGSIVVHAGADGRVRVVAPTRRGERGP